MTTPPEQGQPDPDPYQSPPPSGQGYGYPPPSGQGYGQGYGQDYGPGHGQPAYAYGPLGYGYGAHPGAPYGVDPKTGIPYSDKSKLVAGLLQVLLPLGIGRMYIGDTGLGVAQLLVTLLTCGIGALWPFIDGIVLLVTDSKDSQGRILKS